MRQNENFLVVSVSPNPLMSNVSGWMLGRTCRRAGSDSPRLSLLLLPYLFFAVSFSCNLLSPSDSQITQGPTSVKVTTVRLTQPLSAQQTSLRNAVMSVSVPVLCSKLFQNLQLSGVQSPQSVEQGESKVWHQRGLKSNIHCNIRKSRRNVSQPATDSLIVC